jgi:hypothetical protein
MKRATDRKRSVAKWIPSGVGTRGEDADIMDQRFPLVFSVCSAFAETNGDLVGSRTTSEP